jgi:hypothetical protein
MGKYITTIDKESFSKIASDAISKDKELLLYIIIEMLFKISMIILWVAPYTTKGPIKISTGYLDMFMRITVYYVGFNFVTNISNLLITYTIIERKKKSNPTPIKAIIYSIKNLKFLLTMTCVTSFLELILYCIKNRRVRAYEMERHLERGTLTEEKVDFFVVMDYIFIYFVTGSNMNFTQTYKITKKSIYKNSFFSINYENNNLKIILIFAGMGIASTITYASFFRDDTVVRIMIFGTVLVTVAMFHFFGLLSSIVINEVISSKVKKIE